MREERKNTGRAVLLNAFFTACASSATAGPPGRSKICFNNNGQPVFMCGVGSMKAILVSIAITLCSLPAAASAGKREVFAIIVANNHSNQLGRPDLRYADDDGAKYYEMFELLATAENIHLLAELDRDTLALFPHLGTVAKQPTVRAVTDAAVEVARRARAAIRRGDEVELYFVFAGHGDVDRGVGFLELADGAFTADQLEKHVLAGIPSTRTHVVLDSCNSFFVINARKPGGRRFATPRDITETFAKKLPHVGVFLSTSAEAEVYEWSELQSGIFSHAVRSGLLGAADVNGDGSVTYKELHGFVTIAAADVKNPLFRPHVFARGPSGKNEIALVDLSDADAVAIDIGPEQTRVTVRDRDGLISLTIGGTQMGTNRLVTFCIPRPDQLADGVPIGTGFRIIDFNGEADGCTFAFATGSVPTGTARATGICDNGTNSAGYALTVDGNILLRRTCQTNTDMVAVALSGTVAVTSTD